MEKAYWLRKINKYKYAFILLPLLILPLNVQANTQKELVYLSEIIRKNELDLTTLQQESKLIIAQQKLINEKVEKYQAALSTTIVSAYKLNNLPLKILLNADSNHNPALAYSLFIYYNKYLKNKAANFLEHMALINKTTQEYTSIENQIKNINSALNKNSIKLKHMLASGNDNINTITTNNLQLKQQSDKISYLISSVINKNLLLNYEVVEDLIITQQKQNFIWPNAGYIQSYYKRASNAMYNNGLTMMALTESQIVSPMDGEIVFIDQGDYLGLKNIIIIKHSASYYSLLIGNYTTFVSITQIVKIHEPIAITSKTPSLLYFELQYQNQSINPTDWLAKRT